MGEAWPETPETPVLRGRKRAQGGREREGQCIRMFPSGGARDSETTCSEGHPRGECELARTGIPRLVLAQLLTWSFPFGTVSLVKSEALQCGETRCPAPGGGTGAWVGGCASPVSRAELCSAVCASARAGAPAGCCFPELASPQR